MYHERTQRSIKSTRRRKCLAALVVVALLIAGFLSYGQMAAHMREQSAASVRDAILNSAKQCCAIEGAYPQSLSHLEQRYGLRVNHQDFVITYEAFAGNIAPSVVVVPR